jgi:AAHS family 4-hydroxybenzoate transporter-like MFS transporter
MPICEDNGRSSPPIDPIAFIDAQPIGGFQIRLVLICAAVLLLDGFDAQAMGYVAPKLANDWHLSKSALGPVFSASLFGLMIGALMFGPIADRVGRRAVIILSTLAFSVGALITAGTQDVTTLLVIRFLTGLGLGGAMPNAIVMTSEFSPKRRRATMVMVSLCGFSIGAALAGLLAADLIPRFGWRSVFIVGGVTPLMMIPILALKLPESVRFLALHGDAPKRIAHLLRRIAPRADLPADATFTVGETHLAGLSVTNLFRDKRGLTTVLLWLVYFMSLLDVYFLSNWLPTVLNDLGASVTAAIVIGAMLQVGGVVGTFSLGGLMDRFSFRALAGSYVVACLAIGAIGQAGHSAALVTIAVFAAGFCLVGGQIAVNGLAASLYPTSIKATGIGWALGIGRVGSILGPLVGGLLLQQKWRTGAIFSVAAAAALCAACASALLSRLTSRQSELRSGSENAAFKPIDRPRR